MKITYQSYTSAGADADGLADDVAYAAGGYALSAHSAGDDLAHIIRITNNSSTDYTAANFTVTGTDANGSALSQTIPGPDASDTTDTTAAFATVTSVTSDTDTMADTFDIGWTADAVGASIFLDFTRDPVINSGIFCAVPTGSPTYGVEYTGDASADPVWLAHPTIASKSATFAGAMTTPVLAIRLVFSAAGAVNMTVIEPFRS